MSEQIWWYTARASGIVAWGLSALAVLWGLALSTRAAGRRPGAPWLLDLHRFLGALAVVFVAVHLAGLWLDSYVEFGPAELFVPFAATWQPGPVAWGIVAFYLLAAVEVTSLAKRRLPTRLWRAVHLFSYALYAAATVHLLTAGTDAANGPLRLAAAGSVALIAFFTIYRAIGPGRRASVAGGRTAVRRPAGPPTGDYAVAAAGRARSTR